MSWEIESGSSGKIKKISNKIQTLYFESITLEDVGVYKCILDNQVVLNRIILEINDQEGELGTNWQSEKVAPVSFEFVSDKKLNRFMYEYNSDLEIDCQTSDGKNG